MRKSPFASALWGVAVAASAGCGTRRATPLATPGASAPGVPDGAAPPTAADAGDATPPPPDDASSAVDAGAPDGALTFDLGADISFGSNPNGVWRYGYTVGSTLSLEQFALDTFAPDSGGDPVAFWHPTADPNLGYYPYVAANTGAASASEKASWALRPQEVAMEASNSGQYGMIQFVAPRAGTYLVQVHFEGVHFRISTTDVHVLAGDAGLFAANIDGYGGDPAFHAVQGTNPTADYDASVPLQASDLLTFAIGYGTDLTNYNDTTGLTVHIVLGN